MSNRESLVAALEEAGALSEITFAGVTRQFVRLAKIDTALPILLRFASPEAKAAALRGLLEERCVNAAVHNETMESAVWEQAYRLLAPEAL